MPERGVNLFLGGGGHGRAVVEPRQRPLAQRVAHLERPLPQRDVVRLGAGKVLQRRAIGGRGQQPHIHLQPLLDVEAHLVFAFGDHVVDAGIGGDVFDGRGRSSPARRRPGGQQVEVAHRLAPAAQRARRA